MPGIFSLNQNPFLASQDKKPLLRTILYIEDNSANLDLVERLVARRDDLRLMSAINGSFGMQIARAEVPDMILMDINLPDINGFDAMKILRKDAATARIPIVALSSNAHPRDIEKGIKAGFFRYLTKPFKIDELIDTVDTTCVTLRPITRSNADPTSVRAAHSLSAVSHRSNPLSASQWPFLIDTENGNDNYPSPKENDVHCRFCGARRIVGDSLRAK